jgi:hypothetical protein
MHVRQADVEALELHGEFGVLEAEQMEQHFVQIMQMHRIFGDVETELVAPTHVSVKPLAINVL